MKKFVENLTLDSVGDEVDIYPGWVEGGENTTDISFTRVLQKEDLCERNRTVCFEGSTPLHVTGYVQENNLHLYIRDESFVPDKVIEFIEDVKSILNGESYTFTAEALRNCTLYEVKIKKISRET